MAESSPSAKRSYLYIIGPGLLVAATGVGAGDLATASIAGSKVGLAILWAVVLGAFLKFVLTEGLARYQLATGRTLLEGAAHHFGWLMFVLFIPYFVLWSYFVGTALISACGVTAHAIVPVFDDSTTAKQVFGVIHSLAALALVWIGGFKLFERFMSVCIAIMFVTVLVTACLVGADWAAAFKGLLVPTIPDAGGEGVAWTVALMGGVGGTLTVLCYGYWIREEGRGVVAPGSDEATPSTEDDVPAGHDALTARAKEERKITRLDLGLAYVATAVFGLAMVMIGSTIQIEGKGAGLIVALANQLETQVGGWAKWLFLIGAWGAVFSSLLGVMQAVPYLFADLWGLLKHRLDGADGKLHPVDTRAKPYRVYLVLLALVPMIGLAYSFSHMQMLYAVIGALFMPALALTLLALNGWFVGKPWRNRPITVAVLVATLAFFAWIGWGKISEKVWSVEEPVREQGLPDMPELPESPGVPETPDVPDVPEVPTLPEVPEVPTIPDPPPVTPGGEG